MSEVGLILEEEFIIIMIVISMIYKQIFMIKSSFYDNQNEFLINFFGLYNEILRSFLQNRTSLAYFLTILYAAFVK